MKFLVIRFSSLGDVVLTTALFPNLKKKWPECEIHFLTKPAYAPVLNGNPFVSRVLFFESGSGAFSTLRRKLQEERYDAVVDLQGNLKSLLLRLAIRAPKSIVVQKCAWARRKLVWFKRMSPQLRLSVRERILECAQRLGAAIPETETLLYPQDVERVLQRVSIPSEARLVAVAPGAQHGTKRWLPEYFAQAANELAAFPNTVLLILGNEADREVADKIASKLVVSHRNLAGKTSLSELIAITSKLSLLLTNDSGILHVAEALSIPLVAVFGPTVRGFGFAPYKKTSRVVEIVNMACRPCTLHGSKLCPLGHHNCMREIDSGVVLLAASSLLEGSTV